MRVLKRLILLLFVVALTGCHRGSSPASLKGQQMSTDEYDVLSEWIDGRISAQGPDKRPDQIVIYGVTDADDDRLLRDDNGQPIPWEKAAKSLLRKAPSLQQATLDALRKTNVQKTAIRPSLHTSIRYQIVDSSQLEPMFRKGGGWWPAYYKQFPHTQGLLTFSRVGFSSDGNQAFFHYSNRCEGLCGVGSYVVMEKRANHWVIEKEIEMWVS